MIKLDVAVKRFEKMKLGITISALVVKCFHFRIHLQVGERFEDRVSDREIKSFLGRR